MRMFLPIKGPGGRYLTPNEKIALLILGLTLVLGVLTLLAGEAAYIDDGAQNPIFGFVAVLCRAIGGGIIALYALVLVWSGLIYFKGERIADVAPLGGRMFAALAVTVGVSGALGIAQLDSAGHLGALVGRSLDHTLGGAVGFPILLMLMLLGFHLAGQGAWTALREPMAAAAPSGAAASPHAAFGTYGLDDPAERRFTQEPPMPDDGDPTADERSFAVKQAMEEIERSQGVTIVDVEPEEEARPSIGEDVHAAPSPDPETEEAEVQNGLQSVADALRPPPAPAEEDERDEEDAHGLIPVPPTEIAREDEEYEEEEDEGADEEAEEEAEYEEYEQEDDDEADEDDEEYEEDEEDDEEEEYEDDEDESAEYEEYDEQDEDEEEDDEEEEYEDGEDEDESAEYEEQDEEEDEEDEREEAEAEEAETGFARAEPAAEEAEDEQADGFAEAESDDPYARGGLLRRMQQRQLPAEETAEEERSYTTFDWRGRPLD